MSTALKWLSEHFWTAFGVALMFVGLWLDEVIPVVIGAWFVIDNRLDRIDRALEVAKLERRIDYLERKEPTP